MTVLINKIDTKELQQYKQNTSMLKTLESNDFKGNVRHEAAKLLRLSVQQADRYRRTDEKIIDAGKKLIFEGKIGISSIQPLAKFNSNDQERIIFICRECIEAGASLTRGIVKDITRFYEQGMRSYSDYNRYNIEDIKSKPRKMQCPYCGKYLPNTKEYWELVKSANSNTLFLACIDCEVLTNDK